MLPGVVLYRLARAEPCFTPAISLPVLRPEVEVDQVLELPRYDRPRVTTPLLNESWKVDDEQVCHPGRRESACVPHDRERPHGARGYETPEALADGYRHAPTPGAG